MQSLRSASLAELTTVDSSLQLRGDPFVRIRGIAHDIRTVQRGDLFVALAGAQHRGVQYAREAVHRGAVALLLEFSLDIGVPELIASDTRTSLARVAAAFYGDPSRELDVVGVTGTDGKTTTTYLIDAIFLAAGLTTGFISTVEMRINQVLQSNPLRLTTPESTDVQRFLRQMVDGGARWAVLEATSQGLALNRLDEVRIRVASVTNITADHLDYHGSIDEYRRAKGILFEQAAASGGSAVVNIDDPGATAMMAHVGSSPVISYSAQGQRADVRAADVVLEADGSQFDLRTGNGDRGRVRLPLPGRFNIANALCAAGVALSANVPLGAIVSGLESARAVPGRMERVDEGQPFTVVVDYAHTPAAVTHVLEHLRAMHPNGRLITVIGGAAHRVHKRPQLGKAVALLADLAVLTTDDPLFEDPKDILADLSFGARAAGARQGDDFVCIADRREAIWHALSSAMANDCVVLAGKGHEASMTQGSDEQPWDEAGIAREFLANLGRGSTPSKDRVEAVIAHSGPAPILPDSAPTLDPAGPLTIDALFHRPPAPLPEYLESSQLRTIVATGDIMPSRKVDDWIRNYGAHHPFAHVEGLLQQADLTIGNLEAPLIERCPRIKSGFTFCGLPAFAAAMAKAGIDLVALENNHIDNFGYSGIEETKEHLDRAGVAYATAERMAVRDVRGLKVGVLAFCGVGRCFDSRKISQHIWQSRPLVDLLIVAFHWGKEYVGLPEPCPDTAPDDPRWIARWAIDHGADLIIGNHPHWVQGVEFYNGKLVTYSHGNFVFDQFWSIETRQGVVGKYTFYDTTLIKAEFLPIFIDDQARPHLLDEWEGAPIIRRLEGSSIILEVSK